MSSTTSSSAQSPFVKSLAAPDRPTRDAALLSLKSYLSAPRIFTPLDLLKLWKGLFYSMWMSDRPRPQAQLASDLAGLASICPTSTRIPFLRAFWQTMAREWTNIDVLRMEKFLLLVRRVVGEQLGLCQRSGWERETVEKHMALLEEVAFNVGDLAVGDGIRYHCIDIFVDELERVGALKMADEDVEDNGEDEVEAPLEVLLEPLRKLAMNSPTKTVRRKAKEAREDERLPGNKSQSVEKDGDDEEEGWGGIDD